MQRGRVLACLVNLCDSLMASNFLHIHQMAAWSTEGFGNDRSPISEVCSGNRVTDSEVWRSTVLRAPDYQMR